MIQEFQDKLERDYPVTITLTENQYGITVETIMVRHRGEGVGTKVMQEVQQYALDHQKPVFLTPSTDFGGNLKRLKKFYSRLGFVPNKGRNKVWESTKAMVWGL